MLKKGLEGYPAQTHSKKDSRAAWQLKKAVDKLFKKSGDLRKLAEDMVVRKEKEFQQGHRAEQEEIRRMVARKEKEFLQAKVSFCGLVYSMFDVEFGEKTEVIIRNREMGSEKKGIVFPVTLDDFASFTFSPVPDFCCLLATSGLGAFFEQVEAHVGPKSRKELEAKATKVGEILDKLHERARKGQEAWVKENGITFWLSEYVKRKFVLDLSEPGKLEKAVKAFKFMREHFKSVVEDVPRHCFDCAWAYSERCYKREFPFLYSWTGCDSRDCRFNLEVRAYTDWYVEQRGKGKAVPCGDQKRDLWDGLEAAVDLSLEYGVYPHELFVLPSAEQISRFRADHPVLPKRVLLKQFTTKVGRNKRNPFHVFELFFEGKKEAYCGFRYQEKDEFRLVGLWLWDRMLPKDDVEEVPLTVIESLSSEDWFQASGLGQIWKERSKNVKKSGDADDGRLRFNEIVREFRDAFALTDKSIRNASLLPRKTVKRRKK